MENGSAENVLNTNNQSTTNYNYSWIFLRDNKYESGEYTNDGYDDVTLAAGTLMGRVAVGGALVPLASGASDGSQFPVGILTQSVDVVAGDTVTINICIGGEVAEEKVVLDGSDTLDTVISGRQIRDRIAADTAGIVLIAGTELTQFDNN